MAVEIDDSLKSKWGRTALGCIAADVMVQKAPAELVAEMNNRAEGILQLPDPRATMEAPQIVATRAAYKALGKDPARYRGSAEALLRRITSGKGFPHINNVVDINNLVSVESRMPIGLYDMSKIEGNVVFRIGRAGETYKGIGKYDLNLEGLPVFCDEVGPHGSPTSDSERTMVTDKTRRVLAILVCFGPSDELSRWSQRFRELLGRYVSATECNISLVA